MTPSPQILPPDTISSPPILDVQVPIDEPASEPVASTPTPDASTTAPFVPTPTTVATPPPVTIESIAVDPLAPQLPAATPVPPPKVVLPQDTPVNLGKGKSVEEGRPVPTAAPAVVGSTLAAVPEPTPAMVMETTAVVETAEAAGGAPRFVLPSAQGGQVSLEEYLERGNVVLVFYRAFW